MEVNLVKGCEQLADQVTQVGQDLKLLIVIPIGRWLLALVHQRCEHASDFPHEPIVIDHYLLGVTVYLKEKIVIESKYLVIFVLISQIVQLFN